MAIGIFDSGLGGLTIREAIRERLPDLPLHYLTDAANAPYDGRSEDDIAALTRAGVTRLWDAGCDLVIVGSGTAGAAALRRMQEAGVPEGKRVLGMFVPLIEALTGRDWGDNTRPRESAASNVALFGTATTVESRAFQRELGFRAIGVTVEAEACSDLCSALESGSGAEAGDMVRRHAAALLERMPEPEAAVLGCGHLAGLEDVFRDALGGDVTVLSPPRHVAESLAAYLGRHPGMRGAGAEDRFLTTGDPERAAERARQHLRREAGFEAA